METEQLNIRLPKELKEDLELVSSILKVSKSEWMKTKLAEQVFEEKKRLLQELSTMYVDGAITKEEIEKMVGEKMAGEMEFVKSKSRESFEKGRRHAKET
ncbi:hypothetical protein AKJ41_04055 [candidate division MSBL1 archaeon SCGC-AAA259O05]|uniref:Ribbon-helix-helix protein CopG domain-containing protein n=1 Tax=candidate division MSBL1 archaeon SCGC-AAA259O05 TaxID=1698271 RepID=A0A133V203_9EURY|nr:hypothetical protein AKJ41_04055 [candidate division MSBL1 archaeon SCGC-AAA259O05]